MRWVRLNWGWIRWIVLLGLVVADMIYLNLMLQRPELRLTCEPPPGGLHI